MQFDVIATFDLKHVSTMKALERDCTGCRLNLDESHWTLRLEEAALPRGLCGPSSCLNKQILLVAIGVESIIKHEKGKARIAPHLPQTCAVYAAFLVGAKEHVVDLDDRPVKRSRTAAELEQVVVLVSEIIADVGTVD